MVEYIVAIDVTRVRFPADAFVTVLSVFVQFCQIFSFLERTDLQELDFFWSQISWSVSQVRVTLTKTTFDT